VSKITVVGDVDERVISLGNTELVMVGLCGGALLILALVDDPCVFIGAIPNFCRFLFA
jgi:hypothetical protein